MHIKLRLRNLMRGRKIMQIWINKLTRIAREVNFVGKSFSNILVFIFFHTILPMLIGKMQRLDHCYIFGKYFVMPYTYV